jgi:hypothetical protein
MKAARPLKELLQALASPIEVEVEVERPWSEVASADSLRRFDCKQWVLKPYVLKPVT